MAGFYDTNISSTYSLRLSGGYSGITDTYTWAVTTTSGLTNFPTATHYFDNGSQYYAFSIGTITPFLNAMRLSASASNNIAVKNLFNSLDNVGAIKVYRDNSYVGDASAGTVGIIGAGRDGTGTDIDDPCYIYTDTGLTKTSSYTYKIYNAVYGGYTKSYTAPAYCTTSTQVGACCTSAQTCTCSGSGKSTCMCGSNGLQRVCSPCGHKDISVITHCDGCGIADSACLHANTRILLFDGSYKEISKITSDDILASVLYENDKISLCSSRVVNKYLARRASMYKLSLINNYEIYVTGDHPILTNRGYLTIDPNIKLYDQLALDDIIITKDGNFGIKSIVSIDNDETHQYVYNLYTEHDNFIANNIVVSCENPEVDAYVVYEKTESGIVYHNLNKLC